MAAMATRWGGIALRQKQNRTEIHLVGEKFNRQLRDRVAERDAVWPRPRPRAAPPIPHTPLPCDLHHTLERSMAVCLIGNNRRGWPMRPSKAAVAIALNNWKRVGWSYFVGCARSVREVAL